MDLKRSWEYASWIIEAREKDQPAQVWGTVPNTNGLIATLPHDGVVEVACMINRNGVNPTRFGRLPKQMAAMCASHIPVHDLGADAAIERSKEKAAYALSLDPLTAAVCTPAEIKQMVGKLFDAEERFLPGYR